MRSPMAIVAALSAFAIQAEAAERLSYDGAALPPKAYVAGAPFEAAIDASGDEVLSVHTMLRPASSNIVIMRDRDGFWTEWDGDRDGLAESAARRDGDLLVFKIFTAPPSGVNGMTVTVAYRTPEGLKFGWFEATETREEGE